jgi:hypothetical protein
MTGSSMAAVEAKWNEAHTLLSRLETESKRDEFYVTLNAFLAAARSVLYVLEHQFGWKELRGNQKIALAPPQTTMEDRKRFDDWFRNSPLCKKYWPIR